MAPLPIRVALAACIRLLPSALAAAASPCNVGMETCPTGPDESLAMTEAAAEKEDAAVAGIAEVRLLQGKHKLSLARSAAVQTCNATTPCPTGQTCVTKEDGTWSQCTDCSQPQFSYDCKYWDADLRAAADKACHTSCTIMTKDQGPCHNAVTGCALGLTCATQADGYWSQCISCEDDSFPYACPYWGPQLLAAAESACQKTCTSTK